MGLLKQLPAWFLRGIKRTFDKLRLLVGTRSKEHRDIYVKASIETVRNALGDQYFTNGWELSYNYKGEDMNMRRPLRKDDTYEWYQTHVRGWSVDNGHACKLECHEDLEPTEHPYYHLNPPDDAKLWARAPVDTVCKILDDADIEYEKIES